MAEPLAGRNVDRRLIYVTAAVVAVIALIFLGSLGSCFKGGKERGNTVIYSNLDLRDAANVVARLKELKIPYELRDEGTTVAVPREKAAEARLGLAQKNLPLGGVVGWEIFDETKLGATDFDRRIQLIRAISGELSRTIRRIESVDDCRVQIVLPETKLFEVAKAPVTASVMLKLKIGKNLSPEQVNGIIHLVASSVENLKPENVTIIDDNGRILTTGILSPALSFPPSKEVVVTVPAEVKKEIPVIVPTKEAVKAEAKKEIPPTEKVMTPEERALLVLKAKRELENQLESRAQILLNRFYPPNSVIVKVNLELADSIPPPAAAKKKKDPPEETFTLQIKNLTAVVLVDNRLALTPQLKENTFSTLAAAINYSPRRGDRIELRAVPFHYAVPPPAELAGKVKEALPLPKPAPSFWQRVSSLWALALVILLVLVFAALVIRRRQGRAGAEKGLIFPPQEAAAGAEVKAETPRPSSLEGAIKTMAEESPEKIANLLKVWLTEK